MTTKLFLDSELIAELADATLSVKNPSRILSKKDSVMPIIFDSKPVTISFELSNESEKGIFHKSFEDLEGLYTVVIYGDENEVGYILHECTLNFVNENTEVIKGTAKHIDSPFSSKHWLEVK